MSFIACPVNLGILALENSDCHERSNLKFLFRWGNCLNISTPTLAAWSVFLVSSTSGWLVSREPPWHMASLVLTVHLLLSTEDRSSSQRKAGWVGDGRGADRFCFSDFKTATYFVCGWKIINKATAFYNKVCRGFVAWGHILITWKCMQLYILQSASYIILLNLTTIL